MADDLAPIGHNGGPPVEVIDAHRLNIDDLKAEALAWLNGDGVNTQEEADKVSLLIDMARKAKKAADEARAAEKKPHDDAAKAVQARWKPLIDTADTVADTAKKALALYLQRQEDERRRLAEIARKEAEEKARALAEAQRQADAANLAERDRLAAMEKEAAAAHKAASKAEKATVGGFGGERAVTLRSRFHAVMTDRKAAVLHYMHTRPDDILAFVQRLADQDVDRAIRQIPGFEIREERVAQ